MGAPTSLRSLLAALLFLTVALPAGAAQALECGSIDSLVDGYLKQHIRFHRVDDDIKQRTADMYLRALDTSRVLFLAHEAEAHRRLLRKVFDEVEDGRCGTLLALQEQALERYQAMETFVRETVSAESYAVDYDTSLVIDPEKRGYPKTREAQKELYRKLVHFQMSNYLASDEDLEESKRRLIHRYELNTKRAGEVDHVDIYASFLNAFALALDPHSNYLSAEDLEEFQISMGLSLEGIGVALSSRDGYSVVERIIPGGATDRADALKPNDKIIAVAQEDGEFVDIVDMSLRDVVRLIRGEKGSIVRLIVLRQGENTERVTVSIVRDTIDLEEQAAKLHWHDVERNGEKLELARLELPSFYGDSDPRKRRSDRDVQKLLAEVREKGADGLVLDLSRNGGGLLDHAVRISGFFLRSGGVVAVQDYNIRTKVLPDPDPGILYDGPLVVLISRVSASASEILAGALQDYGRAVIVGDDHSFGKGTVQTVVTLPDGLGAMKVTTGIFYRPGGASTQHEGVESDIDIPSFTLAEELGERFQPYALQGRRIQSFRDGGGFRLFPFGRPEAEETPPWPKLTPALVAELEQRSSARVGEDPAFDPVREHIAERAEDDGVVVLAELQKEREAQNGDAPGAAEPEGAAETVAEAEDEVEGEGANAGEARKPSPQAEEAVRILADLVELAAPAGGTTASEPASEEDAVTL